MGKENMIDQKIFEQRNFHGTKGIVFIGEKMLVYRRDDKTNDFPLHIDLPGGGKENNETPFESFKREVKEEFGIEIKRGDVVYAKQYISVMDITKESYFIVTKPRDVKESEIVLGNEGLEFFLLKPEEYLKLSDGIGRHQAKVADYVEWVNNNKL